VKVNLEEIVIPRLAKSRPETETANN